MRRLDRLKESRKQKRKAEMPEDADMRCSKKHQREHHRLEVEHEQVRESGIKSMREHTQTACSEATPAAREARLQQMKVPRCQRLRKLGRNQK